MYRNIGIRYQVINLVGHPKCHELSTVLLLHLPSACFPSRSRTTGHPKNHNTKCLRLRLPSAASPPLRVTRRAAGQGSLQCHCKKCRLCCVGACRRCNSESSPVTHRAAEPGSLQCDGTRCHCTDWDCVDLRPPSAPPLFRHFKMPGCGLVLQRRPCKSCQLWPLAANCSRSQLGWCLLLSHHITMCLQPGSPAARCTTAVGQPGD